MKNLKFSIFISIVLITVFLQSCHSKKEIEIKEDYPGEWMYNQRAYPNAVINKNAIARGITQTKQALANKTPNSGSWSLVGPINVGGRVTDVAISPENDNHLYISTPVGGVFKSTDKGSSWTPIFDNIGRPSIGNIEIAPSNAQRIYVGTGEANGSATSGAFFGDGVYKSDDAGSTWSHIGLEDSQHIGRLVVDPTNEDRVFVAATGVLYGKNEERGLYRTTNAGNTWDKVLYVSDSTAVIDVAMNPVNTNILFAATWERIRYPWVRDYGGETSGVYRSLDGGDSWTKLANGLPVSDTETGRIGLAISESDPSVVYASYTTNSITNTFDGLYKSTDNGDNWSLVALDEIADVNSSFGWYFGNVRINPTDPNDVFVLGQKLYRTTNGGANWDQDNFMHVDYHSMEFSRNDTDFIIVGNDGGVYLSENGGTTWQHLENLPITQFYNIEVAYQQPNRMFGGAQDNNTLRTVTGSNDDWHPILGGDGFQVNVDKNNTNNVYAEYQWGNLYRSTNGGVNMTWATNGIDGEDRTNWNTPVEISPFNTDVLYFGSNKLYQSTNKAVSWNVISEDLTAGQHPSGSMSYGTLTAIAPSYLNLDVVYTGSDDGNVSVTFNGGDTWQSIDDDLPNRFVTQVAVSPSNDLVAYVTFSGYHTLDYTPHIFKTIDGGENWTDISGNLPSIPINDVVVSADETALFVATDTGVWYSINQGASWNIVGDNLPMTIVADIKIHEPTHTLYAGTFGRSIYSFDISNLHIGIFNYSLETNQFEIFPNPVSEAFTIKFTQQNKGEIKLFITDVQGKVITVLDKVNVDLGKHELNYNVSSLPVGVYFVHLQSDKLNLSEKIIIN